MAGLKRRALAEEDDRRRGMPLGALLDQGLDVFCWCNRCGHNAVVDARQLAAQVGPAMPVPEIGGRMRCSACGAKDVATRPHWRSAGPITRHF